MFRSALPSIPFLLRSIISKSTLDVTQRLTQQKPPPNYIKWPKLSRIQGQANRRILRKIVNGNLSILVKKVENSKRNMRKVIDGNLSIIAQKTENVYTIPNLLCLTRIGLTPVIGYTVVTNQFGLSVFLVGIAGITDLLDGYIARVVPGQSSALGSLLDPMADKILVGTLFATLTYADLIPVPLTLLIIMRDLAILTVACYIRYQSLDYPRTISKYFDFSYATVQLSPTLMSKVNTFMQLGFVGTTLLSTVISLDISLFLTQLGFLTASTTIGSTLSYLGANNTVKYLIKTKRKKEI